MLVTVIPSSSLRDSQHRWLLSLLELEFGDYPCGSYIVVFKVEVGPSYYCCSSFVGSRFDLTVEVTIVIFLGVSGISMLVV